MRRFWCRLRGHRGSTLYVEPLWVVEVCEPCRSVSFRMIDDPDDELFSDEPFVRQLAEEWIAEHFGWVT